MRITRTYIQNRNEFVVILYNKEIEEEGINTIEDKILKFCKKSKSRKEIVELLRMEIITYVYSKYIEFLIKEGKLGLTIPEVITSKN